MSQPLLRLVGRRQAFQQTSIAVKRLGDILDIPQEPHTLAFRDGDHLPWLNKNLDLAFQPGRLPVLMGPRAAARRIIGVCPLLCGALLCGARATANTTRQAARKRCPTSRAYTLDTASAAFTGTIRFLLRTEKPLPHAD